jgi:molybdopterin-guanine dinucleotide biosynthesis protein A
MVNAVILNMTGIILSGGENRRMGTDKAFLTLAGKPIIEHILSVLREVCKRVIIVTNSPERYASYDALVIPDAMDLRGPLTGIYSGLSRSDEEYNFVAACDMPFLNAKLISYIGGQALGYDVTLPCVGGLVEPLHAVYRRGVLTRIESRLRRDRRDIRGILEGANVRYITEEEIDRFDPERRSFRNLNTRSEYEEVLCSDWGCRNS